MKSSKKNKFFFGLLGVKILFGFLAVLFIIITTFAGLDFFYRDKFYKGVKVASINLEGKTKEEGARILNNKVETFKSQNQTLVIDGQERVVVVKDFKPNFNVEESLNNAFSVNHRYSLNSFGQRIKSFFWGISIPLKVTLDGSSAFSQIADELNQNVEDASLEYQNGELTIHPGKPGQRLNFGLSKENILDSFQNLSFKTDLVTESLLPIVLQSDLEKNKEFIKERVSKSFKLYFNNQNLELSPNVFTSWVVVAPEEEENLMIKKLFLDRFKASPASSFKLRINNQKARIYAENLASQINVAPKNAVLKMENGVITVTSSDQNGQKLDVDQFLSLLENKFEKGEYFLELPVETLKADVREDNLTSLGIRELVSTGESNFSGSPQNRIHNIKTGTAKFNGVLIKPGETFSFDQTLGDVDASTGFLPELVILQDRTVPQYGGGLCQVSTTAFRVALNAGLPIIERTNHAYPVIYYYPIGVDATIYPPSPDLQFVNDLSSYLLIQTFVEGNNVRFEFYGTKGTRSVKFNGSEDETNAVSRAEDVSPYLFNQGNQGEGSVDSIFWRFVYENGSLAKKDKFFSSYDSPKKYPHPAQQ